MENVVVLKGKMNFATLCQVYGGKRDGIGFAFPK